ncbi:hypothetical protein PRK78_006707 [Emydomyces testavorans]|uniref:Uncharacterized protein n=1 Tax=Emydomyces testavorans TaxID=2070801 RepID=A0AAF0DM96_9EURO|nr:hypothetical protein PRK78_006707 [Emydomyces testavorans]
MASDSNPNESHAHQKTAPTSTGNGPVHTNIRNEDSNVPTFDQDPTSKQIPHQSKSGKKRSRNENEQENDDQSIHEPSSNKKRKKPSIKSRNSDMQETNVTQKAPYVPVIEVEDISHEVEARLKLKEAARQNRMGRRERKRKRDSAGSVTCDATAAGNMVPKHKKSKTGSCSERNGDIEGLESRGKNKPQGKGRIMDMDDVKQGNTEKRVKR